MKGRLYANWLVIITLFLFFSSLVIFVISIKDTIGIKKCAYGDNLENNCVCSSDGEKVCDTKESLNSISNDFTSSNLIYTFDFLNMIDASSMANQVVKFENISHLENKLKITVEIESMCNEDNTVAPQIGLYKLDSNGLTLSIVSNLTNTTFNLPCVSENQFLIENFSSTVNSNFKISYQDELGGIYQANNCIYEGNIRNDGDVYNSKDGSLLCQCKNGESICEKE